MMKMKMKMIVQHDILLNRLSSKSKAKHRIAILSISMYKYVIWLWSVCAWSFWSYRGILPTLTSELPLVVKDLLLLLWFQIFMEVLMLLLQTILLYFSISHHLVHCSFKSLPQISQLYTLLVPQSGQSDLDFLLSL